jgi:hypothetical protein
VIIGAGPHKGSPTAVVIDRAEAVLGQVRVRASAVQAERLLEWAAAWPERTWAVEGAGGVGHLLAQQLVAAGERVLDVQPKLGARVRLLASGATNKNDPNDARSVAIAALRSAAAVPVRADDHAAVLKVWSKRHRDLSRTRNQVVCRLHAVLCDLVPGGVSKHISAALATRVLAQAVPSDAVQAARHELAAEFLADLRRVDDQLRETKRKLAIAVRASGTRYECSPMDAARRLSCSTASRRALPSGRRCSPSCVISGCSPWTFPATACPARPPSGAGRCASTRAGCPATSSTHSGSTRCR